MVQLIFALEYNIVFSPIEELGHRGAHTESIRQDWLSETDQFSPGLAVTAVRQNLASPVMD